MKVTNWFLNFDFTGRARRSHVWANWFAWVAVLAAVFMAAGAFGNTKAASGGLSVLFGLAMVTAIIGASIDGTAMTFRRAHDTGRSGWVWLLLLIPIVNLLPLYWLLIQDSDAGPNKYGPPVKQFYTAAAS